MKNCCARILVLFLLMAATTAHAQFDPRKVCRVENGNLVFTLDQRWSASQRKEISRTFDLDSALLAGAFALKPEISDSGTLWRTRKLDAYRIELIRVPGKPTQKGDSKEKIFLLDDQSVKLATQVERESVPYGINKLSRVTLYQIPGNLITIFLPGYKNAAKVFIAGSFNAWSTLKTPMQPCDSGWVVTMKLKPGKYSYKFVVDGKWVNDVNNKLRESDGNHGFNNIFFCTNHTFELKGYPDAKSVMLAGTFNGWNKKELRLFRFNGTWMIPMYLRDGTYAYKFIVNGMWITDPANKLLRPDGRGNMNSFLSIGDPIYFTLKGYPNAKKVALAGNFNGWNPEELLMGKISGGWQIPYVLTAGNYEYKFVVDGEWIIDPENPYISGPSRLKNSFIAVKPNHTFRLIRNPKASKVILCGTFNGWDPNGYHMIEREGDWLFPLYLKPGKHLYKFIVDTKWILDPSNDLWEGNEFGTGNSVLWIEP